MELCGQNLFFLIIQNIWQLINFYLYIKLHFIQGTMYVEKVKMHHD